VLGKERTMRGTGLAAAVGLAVVAAAVPAARGDTIHLTNGNAIEVDAWRDAGDAVEFARGGGIIRIMKTDISRIEGTNQTRDLRMRSAPPSATVAPTAGNSVAAAREMSLVLKEGEALFTQAGMDSQSKASAFRRLGEKWRALAVPAELQDLYGRAGRAVQISVEAYEADSDGSAPDTRERIAVAKKLFTEVQAEVDKQSKEG
jgi:hypothetical protein